MEPEDREAATGRSRNVVHILPQSGESVPRFLTAPLERVDPSAGGTQLVVVTEDSESAIALAESVLKLTGLGGIEVFPVTSVRRAARLMQGRPVLAVAGSAADLAGLIRASQLKLQDAKTLVVAWADEVFGSDAEASAAVELVMTEVPKDAARVVVTDHADAKLDQFVERYLRRARRVDENETPDQSTPISVQYVTATAASRMSAMRRLLDEIDPPSAAIIVGSTEEELAVSKMLRALGNANEVAVHLASESEIPTAHAIFFYGMPTSREQLVKAAATNPVSLVAMVQPREVERLRRMAGGDVKPVTISTAGKTARDRERELQRELAAILETEMPAREILAIEPLLDRHDGIEIAAAALRLLERERAIRKKIEATAAAAAPRPEPPRFARRDMPAGRPDRDRRPPRDARPGQDRRPPRDSRQPRDARPPHDRRPPRDRS